jgi:2,3-bisphosphoglycerate-independent phosphoglycerate mutase
VLRYDEESVKAGALGLLRGADFIERVVMRRR